MTNPYKPTAAFVGASWAAAALGIGAYLFGLWNADLWLSEKGYYLTLLLYGLFSVVSLQKSVCDRHEGVPVTDVYFSLSWFSTLAAIVLLTVGLWNASMALSEKGFYAMAYALSIFAVITVQKNTRDLAAGSSSPNKPNPEAGSEAEKETSTKSRLNKSTSSPMLFQKTPAPAAEQAGGVASKPAVS